MNKIISILLMSIALIATINLVSAENVYGKIGQNVTVSFSCIDETTGNVCSGATSCNVTIKDAKGVSLGFGGASYNSGFLDYQVDGSNLSRIGTYSAKAYCADGSQTSVGEKYIIINNRGDREDGEGNLGIVIIWIVLYPFIYYMFVIRTKIPLMNFIGYLMLVINSIWGITLNDGIVGYITLGGSLVIFVDRLYKFLQDFWESEEHG